MFKFKIKINQCDNHYKVSFGMHSIQGEYSSISIYSIDTIRLNSKIDKVLKKCIIQNDAFHAILNYKHTDNCPFF